MNKYFYTCLIGFVIGLIPPVSAQWTSSKLSQSRWDMSVINVGGKAIFAGGYYFYPIPYRASDRVDIFDGINHKVTTAQLSIGRSGIATISVGNLAFFAGGQFGRGGLGSIDTFPHSNVDIYNAETNQWTTAQLSVARSNIAVAHAGGQIIFAGGYELTYWQLTASRVIDIYDINLNQWSVTSIPSSFGSVNILKAIGLGNKVILNSPEVSTFIYDVNTKQWTSDGPIVGQSVTTLGTKAFFVGRESNSNIVNIYNAETNQWTTAQLSVGRSGIAVISVGTKVFFAGGTNNSDVVDIYDTTTDQWTTAQLSVGRSGIAVTNLGDKVFFAGSSDNSNVVDIFDITSGQWSVTELPKVKNPLTAISAGDLALFVDNGIVSPLNENNTGNIDIYSSVPNLVLPVNLMSFTGKWIENLGAQLTWQTSWESNNKHFDIQRSNDAKSFESIDRIEGKGTTKETNIYSFIDPHMSDSISYYRLKQVDLDGTFHYSSIISISRQFKEPLNKLTIWPSPTSTHLNISVSSNKPIQQITVYDLAGRQLSTQTGTQQIIDVSKLPSGTYIIDVTTSDQLHLRSQFIKQQ